MVGVFGIMFVGLICMVLFGLNIWAIVLSGQALNNLVCSEELKIFFIGSIVALGCLVLGTGTTIIVSNSASDSDTTEKKSFTSVSGLVWIFTLIWACLGVGWIQNAVSCNTDIIRSANIVLSILFVNVGIVIFGIILGMLYAFCIFVLFR